MQNFTNFTKIIPVNDKLLCLNCRMFRISNLHSRKTKHLGTYPCPRWHIDRWAEGVTCGWMLWFLTIPHDVPQINVIKPTEARMTADVYTNISRPVATASKAVCCRERQTWVRSLSLCSFSPSSHRQIVEGSILYATKSQRTKVFITCKLWIWMEAIERCTILPGM